MVGTSENLGNVDEIIKDVYLDQGVELPPPVCKRTLAYILRVNINEFYPEASKHFIWDPVLYKRKLTLQDNANLHKEEIVLFSDNPMYYVVYSKANLLKYSIIKEAANKTKIEGRCICCSTVIEKKEKKITLSCNHTYKVEHLLKIVSTQTAEKMLLTPEEKEKSEPFCISASCGNTKVKTEEIKALLEDKYSLYEEEMNKRKQMRTIKLKCCLEKVDADSLAKHIEKIFEFTEGMILP